MLLNNSQPNHWFQTHTHTQPNPINPTSNPSPTSPSSLSSFINHISHLSPLGTRPKHSPIPVPLFSGESHSCTPPGQTGGSGSEAGGRRLRFYQPSDTGGDPGKPGVGGEGREGTGGDGRGDVLLRMGIGGEGEGRLVAECEGSRECNLCQQSWTPWYLVLSSSRQLHCRRLTCKHQQCKQPCADPSREHIIDLGPSSSPFPPNTVSPL